MESRRAGSERSGILVVLFAIQVMVNFGLNVILAVLLWVAWAEFRGAVEDVKGWVLIDGRNTVQKMVESELEQQRRDLAERKGENEQENRSNPD